MFEKYYKILGLSPGADEKALKKAYRKLVLKYHPDVNKSPNAPKRFHEICEAYEVIFEQIQRDTIVNISENEDEYDPAIYEEIIHEAREKARQRAKMRYDKLKAEKEFFENNDLILFFRYVGNYLALPLALLMIAIPVYLAITEEFKILFFTVFFWLIGIFILKHIYDNRKTWFRLGRFTTKRKDIISFFSIKRNRNPTEECFFCKGKMADSQSFHYILLKVRDIKLGSDGVYQHYVRYNRNYREVILPRSMKAYRIHVTLSILKPVILILCAIYLPVPSLAWRVIIGLGLVLFLSNLILAITSTRSKTSFLLNRFLILKLIFWSGLIISQTTWYGGLVLFTSENTIIFLILFLIFLDMFLDLILRAFPFYKKMYLPLIKQPEIINNLYLNGYQAYMDLPIWSTVYPFFRWLF